MRYLIQFIIPALLLLWVVYLLVRRRSATNADGTQSDQATFLAILVVGATLAFGLGYLLYEFAP